MWSESQHQQRGDAWLVSLSCLSLSFGPFSYCFERLSFVIDPAHHCLELPNDKREGSIRIYNRLR